MVNKYKTSKREFHLEDRGANLFFLQAIQSKMSLTSSSKILEIGCGTGVLAKYLSAITGANVLGTEMSKSAHRIASRRIKCYYRPDGNLPEKIDKLDMIYCKDVLPCNKDKKKFYEMIYENLNFGAHFCTYMPTIMDVNSKPLLWYIPSSINNSIDCYDSIQNNICQLKKSGFKKIITKRIFLGTVGINFSYIQKHFDGYFSNTDNAKYNVSRSNGLKQLEKDLKTINDYGITVFYDWERTLIIAQK